MGYDLIIRNGHVFSPQDMGVCDIGIKDGKIASIGILEKETAKEEVDARDMVVFPGLIDPHMHTYLALGNTRTLNTFYSGTVAAAKSGVTTIIDYADQKKGTLPSEVLLDRIKEAEGEAVIDYQLTVTLTSSDKKTLEEIPQLVDKGVKAFKLYTIYRAAGLMLDDRDLLLILREISRAKALATIHAESASIVEFLTDLELKKGNYGGAGYLATKPEMVEPEAVSRVLAMAEATGTNLYFRHISSARSLEAIKMARKRGQKVIVETTPHYLTLDNSIYLEKEGHRNIVHPCLREVEDQETLWKGIKEGFVDCIGTDHCSLDKSQKDAAKTFVEVPGGLPGVDLMLPLVFTYGVEKWNIPYSLLARVLSTGSAKAFGLYPQKGALIPGSDGDIVIIDPNLEREVNPMELPSKIDWSPYEGWKLKGWAKTVISRGEVIVKDGEFLGNKGRGHYLS